MASYPSQIASFPTHVNITEIIDASHPNNIQGEVVALESTIGVNPTISTTPSPSGTFNGTSTTFATIVARLANIETGIVSDAHTQYLRKTGDSGNIITPSSAAIKGLVIQAAASQSANLQEWKNSSGTVVTSINSSGNLIGTASGNVALSTVTTAGDLIVGTGSGSVTRLGIGSASTMLTSNGSSLSWQTIASLQGATGTQGAQGLQGRQGTQGLLGPQGIQGTQGLLGTQGLTGTQGLLGNQGVQGIAGAVAAQGIQGPQGLTGIQGLLGLQGSTGPQGVQGSQGVQGNVGSGFTGVTSTTTATPASTGSITLTTNGQGAFVTGDRVRAVNTTSNYFEGVVTITGGTSFAIAADYNVGTTSASNWTLTIAGVRGVQGATGTQGIQGNTGIQGFGYAQLQGTTGPQGIQGVSGPQGTTGSQGLTGLQGIQGGLTITPAYTVSTQTATAGQTTFSVSYTAGYLKVYVNGVRLSAADFTATNGSSVVIGTALSAGDVVDFEQITLGRGVQGVQGPQGTQGLQGGGFNQLQGTTGLQGASGAQGTTGLQGIQGISGQLASNSGVTSGVLVAGNQYFVDTTAARFLTLTATPSVGDTILIYDQTGTAATNNITVSNNGLNIAGSAQTLIIDVDYADVRLVYRSASYGWTVS